MARQIVSLEKLVERLMANRESRRVSELKALRAELEQRLDRLDFRSESLGPALAKIAQHAERAIRRLTD
jgi:hypothetical protein